MNDWIHTRRGVTLVEGTLPALVTAINNLTKELKRLNDNNEVQIGQGHEDLHGPGSSADTGGIHSETSG